MSSIPLLQPTSVGPVPSFHFDIPSEQPQFQLPTLCHLLLAADPKRQSLETIPAATFTMIPSPGQSTTTHNPTSPPSKEKSLSTLSSSSGFAPSRTPPPDKTSSSSTLTFFTTSSRSTLISQANSTTSPKQSPSNSSKSLVGAVPQPASIISTTSSSVTSGPTSTTNSMATTNPTSTANGSRVKRPIGAIVGGILGGIFGLAIIAAIILFCRRKRQNPSDLDFSPAMRDTNASPFPLLKEEWMARMEAAMDEAAKQTAKQMERVRSKTGSTPRPSNDYHNTSGRQSLDTIGDEEWYGYPGPPVDHATVLPPVPDIFHGEHLRSHGHLESSGEAGTEEATDGLAHGTGGVTASGKPSTSGSLETDKEDVELERERRRKEILEQMRKVLDDSSDGFDSLSDNLRK